MQGPPRFCRSALDKEVGTRILQARKKRSLSRRKLAELAGVGVGTLGKIERGDQRPMEPTLRRIAEVLGSELGDLAPGWAADEQERAAGGICHPGIGLKKLRLSKRVSQAEVAAVAGVSVETLSRFERGLHASRLLAHVQSIPGQREALVFRSVKLAEYFGFSTTLELFAACDELIIRPDGEI